MTLPRTPQSYAAQRANELAELRDRIAITAMQAAIANSPKEVLASESTPPEEIAQIFYRFADAMIAARK